MTEKDTASAGSAIPSFEETTDRIRAINEKILEAGKSAGSAWLDAYEKSLTNLLAFENQAAGASQSDWIAALAKAHTDFVANITSAYTQAARELLK
ncbi:hypothetical protein [[Mycobacterium] crassicus]|uniref:Phasin domain-containing protein n=1 Tax=[Mycobacterium] crassicus TaxID=2872309 RepID=A0ABU5XLC6_9MYCO|nr:hypothetical protein [Mycolicibacter sp. MYC098]MEB3022142.1 hypothetical protein [Mycolicibacter sp. MYC098]